jgi:hypothetical protein
MSILDHIKNLLNNNPPPQRPQYPLYVQQEAPPGVKNLPLQGGVTGGYQRATASPTTQIAQPLSRYTNPNNVRWNLLTGRWEAPYSTRLQNKVNPITQLPDYLQEVQQ